ncbi:MAG: 5-oxoprolinase subunit B family protein [Boseongicola sp.]
MMDAKTTSEAKLLPIGPDGILVRFAEGLSETANRAALAFRSAVHAAGITGVSEVASSLTSVLVRFRPDQTSREALASILTDHLQSRDWTAADLPSGRRHWQLPAVFGGQSGPELKDVAAAVGVSPEEAVAELCQTRMRVLALGFAPGQPYLGFLGDKWDIPRRKELTAQVPLGAIVVAVRQVIPFATTAPTGWRQVGRTPFRGFAPDRETPIALAAGDEISFQSVELDAFETLAGADDGFGGAIVENIV